MMTETAKLSDLIREHGITAHSVKGAKETPENFRDSDAWTVTLRYGRRSMTVPFFQGTGFHGAEPKVEDVLSSLISDSNSVADMSFRDWCADLGYDEDSRRAERIYNACHATDRRLLKFLGKEYKSFLTAENDF